MNEYTKKLITDVSNYNPGALTVIRELQWFTHWDKMLEYFRDTGLIGGALWAKFKDEYHEDSYKFGHAMDQEAFGYYRGENTAKFEANRREREFFIKN